MLVQERFREHAADGGPVLPQRQCWPPMFPEIKPAILLQFYQRSAAYSEDLQLRLLARIPARAIAVDWTFCEYSVQKLTSHLLRRCALHCLKMLPELMILNSNLSFILLDI